MSSNVISPGIFAVVILTIGLAVGCSTASKNHKTEEPLAATINLPAAKPFAAAVIISAAKLHEEYGANNLESISPLWTPGTNAVCHALNDLPDYLRQADSGPLADPLYAKKLPVLLRNLDKTGCQIVGVTYKKKRGILLTCFPYEAVSQEPSMRMSEPGPRYWRVVYLLDKHSFTNLQIDPAF